MALFILIPSLCSQWSGNSRHPPWFRLGVIHIRAKGLLPEKNDGKPEILMFGYISGGSISVLQLFYLQSTSTSGELWKTDPNTLKNSEISNTSPSWKPWPKHQGPRYQAPQALLSSCPNISYIRTYHRPALWSSATTRDETWHNLTGSKASSWNLIWILQPWFWPVLVTWRRKLTRHLALAPRSSVAEASLRVCLPAESWS